MRTEMGGNGNVAMGTGTEGNGNATMGKMGMGCNVAIEMGGNGNDFMEMGGNGNPKSNSLYSSASSSLHPFISWVHVSIAGSQIIND